MGVADDIKKLGEDIVASYDLRVNSYDLRVKEIRKLAKDTQVFLYHLLLPSSISPLLYIFICYILCIPYLVFSCCFLTLLLYTSMA